MLCCVGVGLDPHRVMGLTEEATPKELEDAYKALTKRYRKDSKMKELVEEAYQEIVELRSIEILETEAAAELVVKQKQAERVVAARRARSPFRRGAMGMGGRLGMAKRMVGLVQAATASPAPSS